MNPYMCGFWNEAARMLDSTRTSWIGKPMVGRGQEGWWCLNLDSSTDGEEIKKGGEPKLAASQVSPQKLLERYTGKSEIK